MKKVVLAVPMLAFVLGSSTACATKKFVRGEVGQVNSKVDTLSRSLEETQERTKANEARIGEVDQKVGVADQKAVAAGRSAEAAGAAAAAVNTRADAIEQASKRIVYEVVLNEEKGNFKFGQAAMPETVTPELDQLVAAAQGEPERRVHRDRGPHRQRRRQGHQLQARPRARGEHQALPLRDAPGAAPQDQHHQLRRRQARW